MSRGRIQIHIFLAAFLFFNTHAISYASTFVQPANGVEDFIVQVVAHVQETPASITLEWSTQQNAVSYEVYRKEPSSTSWGTNIAMLLAPASSFTDTTVRVGKIYEYQVVKHNTVSSVPIKAYGYVYSGIAVPAVEYRGKVLLLVDDTMMAPLQVELEQHVADLEGDGWEVITQTVSRNATPYEVKGIIHSQYVADPLNMRTVMLFGHIPVAYSGNMAPDGHTDHRGAWPADTYYADMDGVWTDVQVNNTTSSYAHNHNIPGDGKFDQSYISQDVELSIGRVDLANMTAFSPRTEVDLLRSYLQREHAYRNKLITIPQRAIISDSFGTYSNEGLAQNAWKLFPSLVGGANVTIASSPLSSVLTQASYQWVYGSGSGSFVAANSVGSTADFAANDMKGVFYLTFGSYFGDWNVPNNFLRAPLASGDGLTNVWIGRPQFFFQHMALGEPIGTSIKLSQNNKGTYLSTGNGPRRVHLALMGDPTLRQHIIAPPTNPAASNSKGTVHIVWNGSADPVDGYYVYRKSEKDTIFRKISPLVSSTSYVDTISPGKYVYMIRAVRLENTASGTFYNQSTGIQFPYTFSNIYIVPTLNAGKDRSIKNNSEISFDPILKNPSHIFLPNVNWKVISGTGKVSFSTTNSLSTRAKFSGVGDYVLEVIVYGNTTRIKDTVNVTVTRAKFPLIVPVEELAVSSDELSQ